MIYTTIFTIIYLLEKRYRATRENIEIRRNDVYSFITIAVAVFAISNFSFLNIMGTPISTQSTAEIFYIRTLVDFAGVILLYSQREYKMSVQLRVEASAMEQLLRKQYEHFQLTQETVDLINRKYHDLKHQIALIRLEEDHGLRNQYLEDLESGINLYETNYQTGNRVLDILLAIKSMKCVSLGITLTVVANGSLLNFIADVDKSRILKVRNIIRKISNTVLFNASVKDVKSFLKEKDLDYCYVVVDKKKLVGFVEKEKVVNSKKETIETLVQTEGYMFAKRNDYLKYVWSHLKETTYDVPVIDNKGLFRGVLSADDVLDALSE